MGFPSTGIKYFFASFDMKISSVRFAWNGGNLHGQLQNGYRNPTTVPTEISPFRSAASLSSRQLFVLTCPIRRHWIIRGQRTYCLRAWAFTHRYYFIEISDFHEEVGLPVPMAEKACKIGKKRRPSCLERHKSLDKSGFYTGSATSELFFRSSHFVPVFR